MEPGLGSSDGNFKDGGGFFERQVLLVAEKEDGSAGGGNEIEEGEEGFVGQAGKLGEIGVKCGELFRRGCIEGLPAPSVFELGERDARGDAVGPGTKDGGLAQKRKLAKDLEGGLLKDIVGEVGADEAGDVAAQGCMDVAEELFQRGPVAGLGEKDEEGLIRRLGLLLVHALERGWG